LREDTETPSPSKGIDKLILQSDQKIKKYLTSHNFQYVHLRQPFDFQILNLVGGEGEDI
jgi:hypothetical protein